MRRIKLKADSPFYNNVDVSVIDVTDKIEKKRATIQLEYAEIDVKPLIQQGLNIDEIVEQYHIKMNGIIHYYLAGDFDIIEGKEEVLEIVREQVKKYL